MKKMMLATAFISLGTFAACDATDEPDEVNVTVEEPDTLSDKIEETGHAIGYRVRSYSVFSLV